MTSRSDNIDQIEAKIDRLGLRLPKRIKVPSDIRTPPAWVLRRGDKVYISGHGPQNPDGSVAEPFGKVGAEVSIEQGYESAKLAGLSILGSLKQELGSLYLVTAWLKVRVMVNTIPGFTLTTDVANGFSDLILKLYGPKIGIHARSAIGVEALPMNLPVIIEGLVEIVP
jgi:enamine deaminase RidA (YjgF/YER057c/UK114 family)